MEKKDIHKIILGYIFTVFAVIFLAVAAYAVSQWGNAQAPARTMTVSAQGRTTATPDLAEVSFSVVSQGKDPNTLNTDNNQAMTNVINFVKSLNISSSDIATVNYDLEPNYTTNTVTVPTASEGASSAIASAISAPVRTMSSSTISGYTLTQTVQVKIHDFSNIAKLLGGLPPLGINQISGVTFTFNDPSASVAPARADAMAKARTKAQEMASEAGVSLGKIINVQEYGNMPVAPMAYATMASVASASASTPTIEPGTQDITDQVTIIYAVK